MAIYIAKLILLIMAMVYLSIQDIKSRSISNKVLLATAVAGTLSLFYPFDLVHIAVCLAWSAVIFAVLFLIAIATKERFGAGDAKLIGIITLFVEKQNIFYVLILALIASFLFSVTGLMIRKINLKTQLPFVPFLTIGVIAYLILILRSHFVI